MNNTVADNDSIDSSSSYHSDCGDDNADSAKSTVDEIDMDNVVGIDVINNNEVAVLIGEIRQGKVVKLNSIEFEQFKVSSNINFAQILRSTNVKRLALNTKNIKETDSSDNSDRPFVLIDQDLFIHTNYNDDSLKSKRHQPAVCLRYAVVQDGDIGVSVSPAYELSCSNNDRVNRSCGQKVQGLRVTSRKKSCPSSLSINDIILSCNGISFAGMDLSDAISLLLSMKERKLLVWKAFGGEQYHDRIDASIENETQKVNYKRSYNDVLHSIDFDCGRDDWRDIRSAAIQRSYFYNPTKMKKYSCGTAKPFNQAEQLCASYKNGGYDNMVYKLRSMTNIKK